MSDQSKLSALWPARGGLLTNGRLDTWSGNVPTGWTPSPASRVAKESTEVKAGSYSAKLSSSTWAQGASLYQAISGYSAYASHQISAIAWVKADELGAYVYIATVAGEILAQVQHPGDGTWKRVQVSAEIGASPSFIQIGGRWNPRSASVSAYFDGFSCVLGAAYADIDLAGQNIFPVEIPEQVLSTAGMTADGAIYGVEDDIVIINRPLRFEGIEGSLFRKLVYFYRYIACGPTYEFVYTDSDGYEYPARFVIGPLADCQMIGADLYNCTITLRLTDRGRI